MSYSMADRSTKIPYHPVGRFHICHLARQATSANPTSRLVQARAKTSTICKYTAITNPIFKITKAACRRNVPTLSRLA